MIIGMHLLKNGVIILENAVWKNVKISTRSEDRDELEKQKGMQKGMLRRIVDTRARRKYMSFSSSLRHVGPRACTVHPR